MPPSGYSTKQSQSIVGFLRSCALALESESKELGESPSEGLRRECADIERALPSLSGDTFATHVLRLTRDFYSRVLALRPSNSSEYRESVDRILADVERSVLAVHVPASSTVSEASASA